MAEENIKEEENEIKPIVSSDSVKVKKKNAFEKAVDQFISEDAKSLKSYVMDDVVIPAAKKLISDIFTNGIDILLYGRNGNRSYNRIPAQRVSYSSYYNRDSRQPMNQQEKIYSYDEIVLQNRGEADSVLNEMNNIIKKYNIVKVADLYDLVGLPVRNYTDNNYGWTDLKSADIQRVKEGYLLKLPRPMEIE